MRCRCRARRSRVLFSKISNQHKSLGISQSWRFRHSVGAGTVSTHSIVWSVRDGRPREDPVLLRGTRLPPLRGGAARALHVVVEPGDDVPARRALEVRQLLGGDSVFDLGLISAATALASPESASPYQNVSFKVGGVEISYKSLFQKSPLLDEIAHARLRFLVFRHVDWHASTRICGTGTALLFVGHAMKRDLDCRYSIDFDGLIA